MKLLKKFLKLFLKDNRVISRLVKFYRYNRSFGIFKTIFYMISDLFLRYRVKNNKNQAYNTARMLGQIGFKNSKINSFFYNIDTHKVFYSKKRYLENFTVDYSVVLESSLEELKSKSESQYSNDKNVVIEGINSYIDHTVNYISKLNIDNKEVIIKNILSIKDSKAVHFDEALQRILFFNQIMWQTGHMLVGLGRLDKVLAKYYNDDIENKYITQEEASKYIKDFLCILHEYFWYKSNTLLGDTGQIIVLGGKDEKGNYLVNDLTYMFINELKKIHYPDPKILLRVSKDIPKTLLDASVDCIKTGIGSPLFANDDLIINRMIEFGYDKDDAYNYSVSACWEPLVPGKGVEQNNLETLVFMEPFNRMLNNEELDSIKNLDDLITRYDKYIVEYAKEMADLINNWEYEKEPYVSIFVSDCDKLNEDIIDCRGKYNYCGLTTVSLGNVVNSILNIDKYVFRDNKYTLKEFNELRNNNFNNDNHILNDLKNNSKRYGLDDEEVLNLSNRIMNMMSKSISNNLIKGGKVKIGYSAPSYITHSVNQYASFDGRKNGEPFIVHISSDINGLPYTSLFNFASQLDYSSNKINGNVIDFIVNPSFLECNYDKFIDFLRISISNNLFYEMQMNVVSSKILIAAKNNPKLYPNLIVRVWGFSAYFNDLPESYKDVLILRAQESEKGYE